MTFKPLLASEADLDKLVFPIIASPKLDGIRCLKINGKAVSRSLKPIPNKHVREWIEANLPDGIDGELVLQDNWAAPFAEVTSAIMSRDGEPRFCFAAFDLLCCPETGLFKMNGRDLPFEDRFDALQHALAPHDHDRSSRYAMAAVVPHTVINDRDELHLLMKQHLDAGFEGTMLRDPNGRYKFGRSTAKEGILLKVKHFADEEATVIGVEEEMENLNEATTNALGRTERSTRVSGKRGKGRMGALVCKTKDGAEFNIGTGFTEQQRIELWIRGIEGDDAGYLPDGSRSTIGQLVKFKHQPPPGGRKPGEAPRFPVFLGFRHGDDQ